MQPDGYYWLDPIKYKDNLLYKYVKTVDDNKLRDFRNNNLNSGIDLSVYSGGLPRPKLHTIQAMKELFPNGVPNRDIAEEPSIGNPYTHLIDGLNVSCASLKYAYVADLLDPCFGVESTVWEIGSGYGGLARAIIDSGWLEHYILQDYPVHMELSKYFLESWIADTFDGEMSIEHIPMNTGPNREVDLIINTHSFMEMSKAEILNYFEIIDKVASPECYFYHNNWDKGSELKVKDYPLDKWELIWKRKFPQMCPGLRLGNHYLYKKS